MSVRNCPDLLERCLKSLRERTPHAEIVVVDNMSRDNTAEVAKKYADVVDVWAGPNGTWTADDPWTYDMAASRQRAFTLASGRWRGWVDSDDIIPGPEEAERLLKLNTRWQPPAGAHGKVHDKDAPPVHLTDLLARIETELPDADVIWAPYLYARDINGAAILWQERERIIKWSDPPKWRWAEAAHEILVPIEGYVPKHNVKLAHLLFVHEREFTQQTNDFAVTRHWDVLHRQYMLNDRTTRRCLYLAAYAQQLAPEREVEFIDAAYECATTSLDRYRTLCTRGQMKIRHGLFGDALEAFGAAITLRSDLPDAYVQGGEAWFEARDWERAIDWLKRACNATSGSVDSLINPRFQAIRYPVLLAEAYVELARALVKAGHHANAIGAFGDAVDTLRAVENHPAVGADKAEAHIRLIRAENDLRAQEHAINLARLTTYLFDNDEPAKAIDLLKAVPWNLQDHPLIVGIEQRVAPVERHMTNAEAYTEFYADDVATGAMPSPAAWIDAPDTLARVSWISTWLAANAPFARVLDVGCFDGIVAIPVMRNVPGIFYVGADIQKDMLAAFRARADARGLGTRLRTIELRHPAISPDDVLQIDNTLGGRAEVAIWSEVIEHVPDPAGVLRDIVAHVIERGTVFITTPWGSFDAGHPPAKTAKGDERSPLGHVRAMTPREVVDVCTNAGLDVEELYKLNVPPEAGMTGDGMHIRARTHRDVYEDVGCDVAFVVPGALWDWNASTVTLQGMGASEKSIVQTAKALATDAGRIVEVYGPVPEIEIRDRVRYWPRPQIRHVHDGKIVVSRSPGYAAILEAQGLTKGLDKILWLQDAWYPDLTAHFDDYAEIVVVSEWHKQAMHDRHGVPLDRMTVITNPVDRALYETGSVGPRKNDAFVYASSPDRGLIRLLDLWPDIREKLPEATLDVFYGWRGAQVLGTSGDSAWGAVYSKSRALFEKLRHQPGITVHGMVAPAVLAAKMRQSGVWAYPTHFEETYGTIATEAIAAGMVPVCPPLAALSESAESDTTEWMPSVKDHRDFMDVFVDGCVAAASVGEHVRQEAAKVVLATKNVKVAAEKWRKIL